MVGILQSIIRMDTSYIQINVINVLMYLYKVKINEILFITASFCTIHTHPTDKRFCPAVRKKYQTTPRIGVFIFITTLLAA